MTPFYQEDTLWLRDIVPYNEQEILEVTDRIQQEGKDIQTLLLTTITGVRYTVYPPALAHNENNRFYYTTLPNVTEVPYARKLNFYTWDWREGTKDAALELWQYYLADIEEETALVYLVGAQVIERLEVNCTYQSTYTTWEGHRINYEDIIVDQGILDRVLILRPRNKIIWKYISYPKKPVPLKLIKHMKNSNFNGGMDKNGYFSG